LSLAAGVAGDKLRLGHEALAMTFFGSGALLLIAGLAAVWVWMRRVPRGDHVTLALAPLGVRTATRHPVRSLLTLGLLASATFLVVAVESFHRDPGRDFLSKDAGSGGFPLVGESNLPIYQDLNTDKGRDELRVPPDARRELQGTTV